MTFDICFRLDCSKKIGGGHLSRAIQIKENPLLSKLKVLFIIKGNVNNSSYFNQDELLIINEDFDINDESNLINEKYKAKLVLIDAVHQYSLSNSLNFEKLVQLYKEISKSIVIFDGVGVGSIYKDLNVGIDLIISPYLGGTKYHNVSHLLGEDYFIFDPKFLKLFRYARNISNNALECIVTFGRSDPCFITEFVLESILKQNKKIKKINYKIICGDMFDLRRVKFLKKLALNASGVEIIEHKKSLADLYQEADLCICSTGHTKYEACFFGIITFIISMNNEDEILQRQFDKYNLALHLGPINKITHEDFNSTFNQVMSGQINTSIMTNNCLRTFDGFGLERVCKEIIELYDNC